jgi:hypothetical protein
MLPELVSEQQLLAIESSSVPHMTDKSRSDVIGRHRRRVAPPAERFKSLGQALAGLGVPVTFIPKKTKKKPRTRR